MIVGQDVAKMRVMNMDDIQYGDASGESYDPPHLMKTLVPSPVIKCIFEANVRAPDSQDIVFIKVIDSS